MIKYKMSDYLFFGSASRNAEMAGIKGAFIGSIITLTICLLIAFLAAAIAVYLEEFAPKNRLSIEVNINNLAAVPSVVFGIWGLGNLSTCLAYRGHTACRWHRAYFDDTSYNNYFFKSFY